MGSRQSQSQSSSTLHHKTNANQNVVPREFYGLMETVLQFAQPLDISILVQRNPIVSQRIVELQKDFATMRQEFERTMATHTTGTNTNNNDLTTTDNVPGALDTTAEAYMRASMQEMAETLIRIAVLMESLGGPRVETLMQQMDAMTPSF